MFIESEILCTVLEIKKEKKNPLNLFLRITLSIGVTQPVLMSAVEQQC